MKKFILPLIASALLLTSAPHALAAAYTNTTIDHHATQSFTDFNPCTGVSGTITLTSNSIFHITVRPNNTVAVTGTDTGTATFVPNDLSQPTYTGRFTDWFGGTGTLDPNTGLLYVGSETDTSHFHLTGSDGSTIMLREVSHETITPNGTVTVMFDRPVATCS